MNPEIPHKRAYSATRMVPIAVGLLVALALLPVMALGYLGARDNTGRLLTQNRDILLDGLEQQLRHSLDGTAEQLAVIGKMISDGDANPDDRAGFAQFMRGAAQGQSSLVSIGWLEATGPFRRWVKGSAIEEINDRAGVRNVDGVWQRMDSYRQPIWANPTISRILGVAIIPHLQPVVRDGKLYGILITVLTSDSVARLIDRMEDDITPFVLVGRDRVLVHRNVKVGKLPDTLLAEDRLPRLDEVSDKALAVMWNDPREPSQNVPGRSQVHWTWLGEGYQAQVYSYRSITGYGMEPWLIGIHRSSLATLRERFVIQGLFYGSGLMLLLVVTLAYLLSRRAVRPAGEIADAARALERLDFDSVTRPSIAVSRVSEVRDIGQALTRAGAALKRFQTYVPRALVGQLMAMDETASSATDREVTIMFMDLANYTSFADGRSAREVASYLNGIFAEMGPLIEATGGTIDKYTGDGLMAVWGAPVTDPDHVQAAWGAALSILERLTPLIASRLRQDSASCRVRLGIHTGRVLAGNLGFEGRIDYTIVGRTVNIAQRCQAALKGYAGDAPVALAITEAVREALDLPLGDLIRLPELKGKEAAYRVTQLPSVPMPKPSRSGIRQEPTLQKVRNLP
jgi:adenylate cyclase